MGDNGSLYINRTGDGSTLTSRICAGGTNTQVSVELFATGADRWGNTITDQKIVVVNC